MQYAVFLCRKCGYLCATKEGSKTFRCVKCGSRSETSRSVLVASGISSSDVPRLMAKLKEDQARRTLGTGRD